MTETVICQECWGRGEVVQDDWNASFTCSNCMGLGEIEVEVAETPNEDAPQTTY